MKRADVRGMVHNLKAIKAHLTMTEFYTPHLVKAVEFLEEVAPVLSQMCDSISESSNAMPKATEQLDKVTDATELATTEVMDVVDQGMARVERVIEHLARLKEEMDDRDRFASDLSSSMAAIGNMNGDTEAIKAAVGDIEKRMEAGMKAKASKEAFGGISESLTALQDDLFLILNALQFQDITSQQIRSTNRMLAEVNVQLRELMGSFSDVRMDTMDPLQYRAFDSEATFDFERSGEAQELADQIADDSASGMEEQIDQEAIDALFK
ncbi:MAG: protein phosphatase CheZ [Candidatus Latescibacteria bacterium]|nr:protein phosphatase CheZ [Candidatus Latescibacterota bacterium]